MINKDGLQLIVAMTDKRVIGKPGALPWHIAEDLKRFKKLTTGQTIIMGRNTYEAIGRPLPNRNNVVLDFDERPIEGAIVCGSIPKALEVARGYGTEIFVAGGANIYKQMLPMVDVMHISHVKKDYEGSILFPELKLSEWKEVGSEEYEEFTAKTYERVRHQQVALSLPEVLDDKLGQKKVELEVKSLVQ